jgi:ribosomal protein S18 acetylase RimI-like enzyme
MPYLIYQEDILRLMEEISPPDDLNDNLKYHAKSVIKYYKQIAKDINYSYIIGLLENAENQIVFYNLSNNQLFHFETCCSSIIYNMVRHDNTLICYILVLNTTPIYRNNGYASQLLNDFANDIKQKYSSFSNIRIILSATDESFAFYEKNNFTLIEDDLIHHPILAKHEKYDTSKLYYIFEKNL